MLRYRTPGRAARLSVLLWATPVLAADDAKVSCEILENGIAASGTLVILQGESEVARGVCGRSLPVSGGEYTAVLALDGALDGPEQRQALKLAAGKTENLRADFATGLLEVRIQSQGQHTAGMAVIRRAERQIGTLGSGVAAHLSTGTYQVVARYRAQQKPFDNVQITKGQRTLLEAKFE